MINLGQGHLLTLASLLSIASLSLKTAGPITEKFSCGTSMGRGNENAVYGKNTLKTLLL